MEESLSSGAALLPAIRVDREYTLVLDLDETLIHCSENALGEGEFSLRPFAQQFLEQVSQFYEIVIFTAALQAYADPILDSVDRGGWITHRLYRDHTTFFNNVFHKDLRRLGRDLSRTIIIDNSAENFSFHPDNGIRISSWYDDLADHALRDLCPMLIQIVQKAYRDVRVAMREFKEKSTRANSGLERLSLSQDWTRDSRDEPQTRVSSRALKEIDQAKLLDIANRRLQ